MQTILINPHIYSSIGAFMMLLFPKNYKILSFLLKSTTSGLLEKQCASTLLTLLFNTNEHGPLLSQFILQTVSSQNNRKFDIQ